MHILLFSLLGITILISWLRICQPFGSRLEGDVVLKRPMPLLARMRMHTMPSLLATLLAATIVFKVDAPMWFIGLPVASFLILISLPINFTLTTRGIRIGRSSFRRWTEFAGATRRPGGARLQGVNRRRGMRIWLSGTLGDDEFLLLLRQSIRDGYKGENRMEIVMFSNEHRVEDVTAISA